MSIGETIRKLRQEQGLTQERLAEILSISPQAVSRWETNMTMPDISLIAPICNLFNITSDKLLGINIENKQSDIENICAQADLYSKRGYLSKAHEILDDALRRYPENCDIIYNLMYISYLQKNTTGDKKYLYDAIKYGKKVLEISSKEYQRHSAVQILCFSYSDIGQLDEAVKMAESMPFMSISKEMLLCSVYTGNKLYTAKQNKFDNLLQFLSNTLFFMQTKLDSGEMAYTPKEQAILRDKRIELLHLFFENGDFGFYHTHLCDTHCEQAFYYAEINDFEKALEHLSAAADHAVKFITEVDSVHSSLILRGMALGSWSTTSPENDAKCLLKKMQNSVFDKIRHNVDFIRIGKFLSEYTDAWSVEAKNIK